MNTAVVPILAGARPMGIVPASFEDVQRIATMAITSGLFKGDRNDSKDALMAKATMAIMQGLEVGVPPMQAVQSIAVINGKCVMYGDLLKGVLWAAGFDIEESLSGNGDAWTATCTITRPTGKKITRTYSVAQAKKARLWDDRPIVKKKWNDKWEDKPNDNAWYRFPDRMLGWRAFGFCCKDGASDVTRGLLVREDVEGERTVHSSPVALASMAVLDIPDIPDAATGDDDVLTDVTGAVAMIREALTDAPADERDHVWESNGDLINRLPMSEREALKSFIDDLAKESAS